MQCPCVWLVKWTKRSWIMGYPTSWGPSSAGRWQESSRHFYQRYSIDGKLLSFALFQLLTEISSHRQIHAPIHLDVLQTLLQSESCPPLVLRLSAASILRTIPQPKPPGPQPEPIDFKPIRQIATKALKLPDEGQPPLRSSSLSTSFFWLFVRI